MAKYKEHLITLTIVVVGVLIAIHVNGWLSNKKALKLTTDPTLKVTT